jgi:hypothetical protein
MQRGDEVCEPRYIKEGGVEEWSELTEDEVEGNLCPIPEGSVWKNSRQIALFSRTQQLV